MDDVAASPEMGAGSGGAKKRPPFPKIPLGVRRMIASEVLRNPRRYPDYLKYSRMPAFRNLSRLGYFKQSFDKVVASIRKKQGLPPMKPPKRAPRSLTVPFDWGASISNRSHFWKKKPQIIAALVRELSKNPKKVPDIRKYYARFFPNENAVSDFRMYFKRWVRSAQKALGIRPTKLPKGKKRLEVRDFFKEPVKRKTGFAVKRAEMRGALTELFKNNPSTIPDYVVYFKNFFPHTQKFGYFKQYFENVVHELRREMGLPPFPKHFAAPLPQRTTPKGNVFVPLRFRPSEHALMGVPQAIQAHHIDKGETRIPTKELALSVGLIKPNEIKEVDSLLAAGKISRVEAKRRIDSINYKLERLANVKRHFVRKIKVRSAKSGNVH